MRHLKARQHNDTGLWLYTSASSRGAYPIGYCSRMTSCKQCDGTGYDTSLNLICEPCGGSGAAKKTNPCEGHVTAEEAEAHYKKYLLDKATFDEDQPDDAPRTLSKCEFEPGCTNLTSGGANVGGYHRYHLCADHRTREALDGLVHVHESWES